MFPIAEKRTKVGELTGNLACVVLEFLEVSRIEHVVTKIQIFECFVNIGYDGQSTTRLHPVPR